MKTDLSHSHQVDCRSFWGHSLKSDKIIAGNYTRNKGKNPITCGAKIYAKVPNTAPPKRKPVTKSPPPPWLLSLHTVQREKG